MQKCKLFPIFFMSEIVDNKNFCRPKEHRGQYSGPLAGAPTLANALPFFQTWETTAAIWENTGTWTRPQRVEAAHPRRRGRPPWRCTGCCRSWPPSGTSWRNGRRAERWPGTGCMWAVCSTGCCSASTCWRCWPTESPWSRSGPFGSIPKGHSPAGGGRWLGWGWRNFKAQGMTGTFSRHIYSSIPVSNANSSLRSQSRVFTLPPETWCSRPLHPPPAPPAHYGFKTRCVRARENHASPNFTLYIYASSLCFPSGTSLDKALWNSAHLLQLCV